MPVTVTKKRYYRVTRFVSFLIVSLLVSLFALAQVNIRFRMLTGYTLSSDARTNKGRPTLFVFEQEETMADVFKPAAAGNQRSGQPNFNKEMVIGIAVASTTKPLKLSVSRVFVQDSTLTVRYVSMTDTTQPKPSAPVQPTLLLSIPKQTVLKTRLVENGKVVQTIQKRDVK